MKPLATRKVISDMEIPESLSVAVTRAAKLFDFKRKTFIATRNFPSGFAVAAN